MNQLRVMDYALRGARKVLDTKEHLYQMYKAEGDEKWMAIYAKEIEEVKDELDELKDLYQQAHVEFTGVRMSREWLKRIYDI